MVNNRSIHKLLIHNKIFFTKKYISLGAFLFKLYKIETYKRKITLKGLRF